MINLCKSLLVSPVVFGVMLLVSTAVAIAGEKQTPEVTSVAQSAAIGTTISAAPLNQLIDIKAPSNT
jgi:hypothetical protein